MSKFGRLRLERSRGDVGGVKTVMISKDLVSRQELFFLLAV